MEIQAQIICEINVHSKIITLWYYKITSTLQDLDTVYVEIFAHFWAGTKTKLCKSVSEKSEFKTMQKHLIALAQKITWAKITTITI